jgi:thiamine biosynthesis lipoprotein
MPPPEAGSPEPWLFEAIGTQWTIDGVDSPSVRKAVAQRIEQFDRTWSRFRADSLVTKLAADGGTAETGPETGPLIELYARLHALTGGAVNPLVGGALAALGYDAELTLRPSPGKVTPPIAALGWTEDSVTLTEPALLDVGAAGKGLLVDLVARICGDGATVDAGSDLRHAGRDPLRVALEHPTAPELAVGVVEVASGALCASAVNRRAWGDGLHHVIDARTGAPTRDVVATWVLAPEAMVADGLATALFFVSGEALAEEFECDWVRMTDDGRVTWSAGLPGEVFAA